jgi:glycosyltransferase involved in cell wall biosynthesis
MLVANDVATDTRVKKEALALAAAGLRVSIVGAASPEHPSTTTVGPVIIMRAPVAFAIRDEVLRRASARSAARALLTTDERGAAIRARLLARERDIVSRAGLSLVAQRDGVRGQTAYAAGVAKRRLARQVLRACRLLLRAADVMSRRAGHTISRVRDRYHDKRPLTGRVAWRKVHPQILDYELAFAPVVDALAPDVIHAHDMHVVGIAAHARARAKRAGRDVPWVYDAHEYVPGLSQYGSRNARVIAAWADLENEFIRDAARVVTVSPAIADALEAHYSLSSKPAVVLNIPTQDPQGPDPVVTLREVCGLGQNAPLLTYIGGMTTARGVNTAIEAMQHLTDAHLALVCVPHNDTWFVRKLRQQAAEQGVSDRVHFVNPVGPGQVVDYLRGVDVGLIPILSFPSHEMALPNKLFEYLHASIPVVSSELQCLGAFLRKYGVGLTFPPGDVAGLVAAVRRVLVDHDRFRAATKNEQMLQEYSWSHQADELRRVYSRLLRFPVTIPQPDGQTGSEFLDLTETAAPSPIA